MLENSNMTNMLVILIIILGTYALRILGLLFSEKIPNTPKFNKFMDVFPGTILLSVLVPIIMNSGMHGVYALMITVVNMIVTKSILLSMCVGVLAMIVLRQYM